MAPVLNFVTANPSFRTYAVFAGFWSVKLMLNSAWIVRERVTRKIFSSPEDVATFGGVATNSDAKVERLKR